MPRDVASYGTFDRLSFNNLLQQYDRQHCLPPTLELTQAFLMTSNMKNASAQIQNGGYFFCNDYVSDALKLSLSESVV